MSNLRTKEHRAQAVVISTLVTNRGRDNFIAFDEKHVQLRVLQLFRFFLSAGKSDFDKAKFWTVISHFVLLYPNPNRLDRWFDSNCGLLI